MIEKHVLVEKLPVGILVLFIGTKKECDERNENIGEVLTLPKLISEIYDLRK